jgi:hypothetical protein
VITAIVTSMVIGYAFLENTTILKLQMAIIIPTRLYTILAASYIIRKTLEPDGLLSGETATILKIRHYSIIAICLTHIIVSFLLIGAGFHILLTTVLFPRILFIVIIPLVSIQLIAIMLAIVPNKFLYMVLILPLEKYYHCKLLKLQQRIVLINPTLSPRLHSSETTVHQTLIFILDHYMVLRFQPETEAMYQSIEALINAQNDKDTLILIRDLSKV